MGWSVLNPHRMKACAFCKQWYDPTNSAIRPKAPAVGLWEYDPKATNKCLRTNADRKGSQLCHKYECKV